jgi:hypothetical protein
VPHPCAFFAQGWDSTLAIQSEIVILSEAKDLLFDRATRPLQVVILSGAGTSRSEVPEQSKDPCIARITRRRTLRRGPCEPASPKSRRPAPGR